MEEKLHVIELKMFALTSVLLPSIYREMTKRPIFKITGYFSETRLFKIPVQPPIFRNSKGELFFLITRSHSN